MQKIQEWLKNGWFLVKSDFKKFIKITCFVYIFILLALMIPFVSTTPSLYTYFITLVTISITPIIWPVSALTFILSPVISSGFFYIIFRKMEGEEISAKDILKGLNYFLPVFLANAIIVVSTIFGLIILIIPGLIISSLFMFTIPLIVEKKLSFWNAMEESRKVVQKDLPNFLVFLTILMGINLLGILCLGIGLFVSTPVIIASIAYAYRDLF